MSFAWPLALFGLLPVFLIAAVYVAQQRRRRRFALTYPNVALLQSAAGHSSLLRRHGAAAAYLLAMTALVLALARPQATFAKPESTGLVILAIDASGSMTTTDILPSRIDAARAAVQEFVKRQPKGVRMGVVTFSQVGVLVVPPTEDKKQVLASVDYLTLGRGTNIGDGLLVSMNAILQDERGEAPAFLSDPSATPTANQRALHPTNEMIVLLSDGAATTGPAPLDIADQVGQAGIRVYTVGLGANGRGSANQQGVIGFGRFMELDEPTLKGIAEKTDGQYFAAQDAGQLHNVYKDLSQRTTIQTKPDELTYFAGGIAAVFMIGAGLMAAMWSNRLP